MKYTKSIISFMCLNLLLVFLMIFIANKTREIEKNNINLKIEISKLKEDIKINKIEFITHQNSSYLKNLYSLYFPISKEIIIPNVISLNQLKKTDQKVKLVNTKN